MENSVGFIVCSIFYSILLCYLVIIKKRKNLGDKTYFSLVIVNLFCLILEISNYYTVRNIDTLGTVNLIVSKLYLLGLFTWAFIFTKHIYLVSRDINGFNRKDLSIKQKRLFNIYFILYIIYCILIVILPINFSTKVGQIYSYGPAVQAVYVAPEVLMLFCMFLMFSTKKNVSKKNFSPIFILIIGGIITMLIQASYPQMLLSTSMETFVTFIMYFIIENNKKEAVKKIEKENK